MKGDTFAMHAQLILQCVRLHFDVLSLPLKFLIFGSVEQLAWERVPAQQVQNHQHCGGNRIAGTAVRASGRWPVWEGSVWQAVGVTPAPDNPRATAGSDPRPSQLPAASNRAAIGVWSNAPHRT